MTWLLVAALLFAGSARAETPIQRITVGSNALRADGRVVLRLNEGVVPTRALAPSGAVKVLERLVLERGVDRDLMVESNRVSGAALLATVLSLPGEATLSVDDRRGQVRAAVPCPGLRADAQTLEVKLVLLQDSEVSLARAEARFGRDDCLVNALQLAAPQALAKPLDDVSKLQDEVESDDVVVLSLGERFDPVIAVDIAAASPTTPWVVRTSEPVVAGSPPTLIVFGGSAPASVGEELSLEVQVKKLESALGARSPEVLFGAGESKFVRVLKQVPAGGALAALLGLPGLPARRPTTLTVEGVASRENVLDALSKSAHSSGGTVVFGVGHGTRPAPNGDGSIDLAGQDGRLWVSELERSFDAKPREGDVALVLGHCFSGAFAKIARRRGAGRCALTAVPPDRPSDGCVTEEADRSVRAYAWMMGEALVRASESDVNGDGLVSLAEAHAFARIHDPTANVPYSSSEDWIRFRSRRRPIDGTVKRAFSLATAEDRAVLTALRPDFVTDRTRLRAIRRVHRKRLSRLTREFEVDRLLERELGRIRASLQREFHEEIEVALQARTRDEVATVDQELAGDARLRDLIRMHGELRARNAERREEHHQIARIERFLRAAELALLEARMRRRDAKALERIRSCEALTPTGG